MTSLPKQIEEEELTRQENLEKILKLASSVPLDDDCKDPDTKQFWVQQFIDLVSWKKASDEKNERRIADLEEQLRLRADFQAAEELAFASSFDKAKCEDPETKDHWMKNFLDLSAEKKASDSGFKRQIASMNLRILELTATKKRPEKALELIHQGFSEIEKIGQVSPGKVKDLKCQICGDSHNTGQHYGAITCVKCSDFFYRNYDKHVADPCVRGSNDCEGSDILKCKRCRLCKCNSVGMKKVATPKRKRKTEQVEGTSKKLHVQENEE
uniref:Nuclear receptor domain-containing protein n=1 Tax=Meloidogyne hapla TaxID=6305 RepID=A0A1I8BSJ1_MELHA